MNLPEALRKEGEGTIRWFFLFVREDSALTPPQLFYERSLSPLGGRKELSDAQEEKKRGFSNEAYTRTRDLNKKDEDEEDQRSGGGNLFPAKLGGSLWRGKTGIGYTSLKCGEKKSFFRRSARASEARKKKKRICGVYTQVETRQGFDVIPITQMWGIV